VSHPLLSDCWAGRDVDGRCNECGRLPGRGHPWWCGGPIQWIDRVRLAEPGRRFLASVGMTVALLRRDPTVARGMMIELR
jgi:hypothetical protein